MTATQTKTGTISRYIVQFNCRVFGKDVYEIFDTVTRVHDCGYSKSLANRMAKELNSGKEGSAL